MKERPILFKGEMVKAILDGRKTQTRRIAKEFTEQHAGILKRFPNQKGCRHGEVGDRLWVREAFADTSMLDARHPVTYRADMDVEDDMHARDFPWKPSIFMPRAVSRLTLEIVSLRVERLQDITEEDAKAEGVPFSMMASTHRLGFQNLWASVNGLKSWDENPFSWVIEFKRLTP